MSVAIEMSFKGGTLAQYDRVLELMGLTPGGAGPPGALFHWAAATEDGIRVVDVWTSKEQYEEFAEKQIGPFAQQAGFAGPPELAFFDVHSYFTAG